VYSTLGPEFPRLAAELARLQAGQRDAAVRRVVEGALSKNAVTVPAGDTATVERLVWSLDDAAWKLQEEVAEGRASASAYNQAFRQARAANGLLELLQGRYDRALYEATHALYGNEDVALELLDGPPATS
jgi:hypothetical protein